jgi:hypothetical protein
MLILAAKYWIDDIMIDHRLQGPTGLLRSEHCGMRPASFHSFLGALVGELRFT